LDYINPNSLKVIEKAMAEPTLKDSKPFEHFQFERLGYFVCDPDTNENKIVFNRTVPLKDEWAKILKKGKENV